MQRTADGATLHTQRAVIRETLKALWEEAYASCLPAQREALKTNSVLALSTKIIDLA